jgi:Zn-dependent peptidase ImmA (M78 family)
MLKDKYDLAKAASEIRRLLGEDDHSYIDVFRLAHSIEELTLVFYPMGEHISGMCIKNIDDILIAINSSMTYGRQRFSIAHELYHYYYDNIDSIICMREIGESSGIEKQANIFASFFLAPPAALSTAIKRVKKTKPKLEQVDVVKLEQYFGLSRQAMLIRLIDEKELSFDDTISMRSNIISYALSLGYDDTLYRSSPEERAKKTYGRYIKLTDELLERGLISNGKYEELLLEAFRADLVYGLDEGSELVD